MNPIHRRTVLLLFVSCLAFHFLACESSARAGTALLAGERVNDTVWGKGATGNEAKADAEKQAREKSGGDYVVVKVEVKRLGEIYHYTLRFSYAKP